MKLILKEDVENLGVVGAIVDVANGYGRNFLLPRNLAVEANPNNIKQFEHEKKIILARASKIIRSFDDLAKQLSGVSISFEAQAGEEDKLFGSITSKDIAEAIEAKGFEIDKRKIQLSEPIKKLGQYDVAIKLHPDVIATVKVEVKKAATAEA